jgi:hypothetical protein
MKVFSILNKENQIDLSTATIEERINAPLVMRLKRYKDIKQETSKFTQWVHKHDNKLTYSWRGYVEEIKVISFNEYCQRFYNGTLEEVDPKSYKNIFKD